MSAIKKGDIVTGVRECIMELTHNNTITVGKDYKVVYAYKNKFQIIDDEGDEHFFSIRNKCLKKKTA